MMTKIEQMRRRHLTAGFWANNDNDAKFVEKKNIEISQLFFYKILKVFSEKFDGI